MAILDTNVLIRQARGEPIVEQALLHLAAAGEPLRVPAIAVAEFLDGADDPIAALATVHRSFDVVPSNDNLLLEAAQIRKNARRKGAKVAWPDALVAAQAALDGTFVVTTNKRDFTALGVLAWNYEKEKAPPK